MTHAIAVRNTLRGHKHNGGRLGHRPQARPGNTRNPFLTRSQHIETKNHRVNEQIRTSPVRVIGADGSQMGIMMIEAALAAAREAGLDLVEVAPAERPPVCRIMDYGKFKYQQKKRQHKAHAHQIRVKEIRVRPKTGEHDVNVKLNHAREFLAKKDKVLVSVIFRGRELAHVEEGRRVIQRILDELADIARVESPPSQQGRRIVCTLAPK